MWATIAAVAGFFTLGKSSRKVLLEGLWTAPPELDPTVLERAAKLAASERPVVQTSERAAASPRQESPFGWPSPTFPIQPATPARERMIAVALVASRKSSRSNGMARLALGSAARTAKLFLQFGDFALRRVSTAPLCIRTSSLGLRLGSHFVFV